MHGQQTPAQARAVVAAGGFCALRISAVRIVTERDTMRTALVYGAVRLVGDSTIRLEPLGCGSTLTISTSRLYEARSITDPELRARGVMAEMASSNRRHVANGSLVGFEETPSD